MNVQCYMVEAVKDRGWLEVMAMETRPCNGDTICIARIKVLDYEGSDEGKFDLYRKEADEAFASLTHCQKCNQLFGDNKIKSAGLHHWWTRKDTGELVDALSKFPPGAMYYADWYKDDDGKYLSCYWDNKLDPPLIVITPAGEWNIDSRCNNCTLPNDRTHRCWVRHGEPPNVTVGKGGFTCNAGAGSILIGSYHAMLENGVLRQI